MVQGLCNSPGAPQRDFSRLMRCGTLSGMTDTGRFFWATNRLRHSITICAFGHMHSPLR